MTNLIFEEHDFLRFELISTSYLIDSCIFFTLKTFGLKMIVKSGLEKIT